jgi:hypothetical protein
MKKEILIFLLSLFFSMVFAIIFLEFYFSDEYWLGNFFTHNGKSHNTQFDPKLGWNAKSNTVHVENGITYTTNSLGFRSNEVNPSQKHILVLGDSIAWGKGVQDNETISYYLNDKIREYQALNMGVVGYGIDQYYLNLIRHIDKLNPILIIIIICMSNDLEGTISDTLNGKSKPLFVMDKTKLDVESGKIEFNPNILRLTNFNISPNSCTNVFTRSWTLSHPIFQSFRNTVCNTRTLDEFESQYVILSIFHKLKDLATKKGSKLLFALSPPEIRDKNEGGNLGKKDIQSTYFFQYMFKSLNYPYVDFFETISKRKSKNKGLYIDGLHFSSLGNQLFSNSIYNFIKNKKIIPLSIN